MRTVRQFTNIQALLVVSYHDFLSFRPLSLELEGYYFPFILKKRSFSLRFPLISRNSFSVARHILMQPRAAQISQHFLFLSSLPTA